METTTAALNLNQVRHLDFTLQGWQTRSQTTQQTGQGAGKTDTVEFGISGRITVQQSMSIVYERSIEKLRSVVDEARAELGIPEGAALDTSPEATAQRIVDFALGAFDAWRENHADLADDEARQQFVDFIGAAINQGIEEARGILTALNALSPEVDANINTTFDIIQEQLNQFAAGE